MATYAVRVWRLSEGAEQSDKSEKSDRSASSDGSDEADGADPAELPVLPKNGLIFNCASASGGYAKTTPKVGGACGSRAESRVAARKPFEPDAVSTAGGKPSRQRSSFLEAR